MATGLQKNLDVRQAGQFVERGHHVLVAVEPALASLRVDCRMRKEAGAVEVDVGTEYLEGER